jgi:hypothetical protein
MLGQVLTVATAALSRGHTITLCCTAMFSVKSCYNDQCELVLSNYSNYMHAQHLCDAQTDAGTSTNGSYCSTVKQWYKHTVQYSEL